MWPEVDVVFGHKALPVVELSGVPIGIVLHVGDLETQKASPCYKARNVSTIKTNFINGKKPVPTAGATASARLRKALLGRI